MGHDNFRRRILRTVCGVGSFTRFWPSYRSVIGELLGPSPSGESIFNLGSHLSDIFRGQNSSRRQGQGALSGAGTAWECLAVWYLNFVFWNTEVLATKSRQDLVPQRIRDALSVTLANETTNTESDVLVFSIPGELSDEPTIEEINQITGSKISDVELAVIQLKTNWNDNAQIPMLWDIVYNSYNHSNQVIRNLQVGINGVTPQSFKKFSYSFLTVPTTTRRPRPGNVAVTRVGNLSGGNYWGMEGESGVAQSFKDFFTRNYGSHFSDTGSVQNHISQNLNDDPQYVSKFLNLNF